MYLGRYSPYYNAERARFVQHRRRKYAKASLPKTMNIYDDHRFQNQIYFDGGAMLQLPQHDRSEVMFEVTFDTPGLFSRGEYSYFGNGGRQLHNSDGILVGYGLIQ